MRSGAGDRRGQESFEAFVDRVRSRLGEPLPGPDAHRRMAPPHRDMIDATAAKDRPHNEGAVLILLYPRGDEEGDEVSTVFTVRHPDLRYHGGQISFPGGRREPGEPLEVTAVREAEEEVGIDRHSVEVLGSLTPLFIPPSRFIVHPYVAAIRHVDDLNHYRLKSNALRGLAIGADSDGDGDFGWAAFLGKSTYREPGWTESEGNHDIIAYVEDRGQPGTGVDRFWIEVLDQNDVLIPDISMDRDAPDNAETIQGGNIVVPHKPKGPKAAKALEILARVDGLSRDEPAASKDADASSAELPIEFGIAQNYPNPFSTSTTISFQLPEAASVQLSIYDLTGKEVRSLVDHNIPAGFHDVTWRPEGLSSGLYIYRFSAGTFVETRRLVFLK